LPHQKAVDLAQKLAHMPATLPSEGLLQPAEKKTKRKIKRRGAHPKRQYAPLICLLMRTAVV
jgi:hypothetical protein